MLSATEAMNLYDANRKLAEKYILEYIEPEILKNAPTSTQIELPAIYYNYVGYSLKIPTEYIKEFKSLNSGISYYGDFHFTKEIVNILIENKYKLSYKEEKTNSLNQDVRPVTITISWKP